MRAAFSLSSNAGSGSLLRSAGKRGGLVSRPAAPPHSQSVPAARLQARRQIVRSFRVAARPGRVAVAAARVVKEIKLSKPSVFHVLHMTSETRRDAPQFRV